MNRKMPPVHINVILPSSKSVLITIFKEAARLNRREAQLPCILRQLSQRVTNSAFQRSLPPERCKTHFVLQMICPFPFFKKKKKTENHVPLVKRREGNWYQLRTYYAKALSLIPYHKIIKGLFFFLSMEIKMKSQRGKLTLKGCGHRTGERRGDTYAPFCAITRVPLLINQLLTPNQNWKVNQVRTLQRTLVGKWQAAGTSWHLFQTAVCLGLGFCNGIHMLCKANVRRQPSVLMFFGIKLHDCALLSKMCKCVNYAETDCQCKLKKWKIWCTLTARVQGHRGVACHLMLKAASKLSTLGASREDDGEKRDSEI